MSDVSLLRHPSRPTNTYFSIFLSIRYFCQRMCLLYYVPNKTDYNRRQKIFSSLFLIRKTSRNNRNIHGFIVETDYSQSRHRIGIFVLWFNGFCIVMFILWPILTKIQWFFSHQKTGLCRRNELSDYWNVKSDMDPPDVFNFSMKFIVNQILFLLT